MITLCVSNFFNPLYVSPFSQSVVCSCIIIFSPYTLSVIFSYFRGAYPSGLAWIQAFIIGKKQKIFRLYFLGISGFFF